MRLPKFKYLEPKPFKEAVSALASDAKGIVLLAGGTDLLVNMKHKLIQPKQIINLKTIPKLAYISIEFNFHKENLISTKLDTRSLKKRIDVKKMFC